MKKLSLYIHIPFCSGKCPYCDFYSVKAGEKIHAAYTDALIKQMKEYSLSAKGFDIDTIYIGGGTPTVIGIEQLSRLIKSIKANFDAARVSEFTVETNPAAIDAKGLKKLRKAGVNRLSLGLQSAHNKELKVLARKHDYSAFVECVENARAAGFDNVSVDVMYGLPTQTTASFYETLKRVADLAPEHISAYGLKIELGTPFHKNFTQIEPYMPNDDVWREMYFMCCDFLSKNGYNHYEISNFAKKGFECRHNLKYWQCGEYLGLGTGAHSYFGGSRFSFKKNIKAYIQSFKTSADRLESIDVFDSGAYNLFDEHIQIKPNERIGEYVMLSFRLKLGINKNDFARLFLKDFDAMYYEKTAPFIRSGHIIKTLEGYALTLEGMLVSNYILSRIVEFG